MSNIIIPRSWQIPERDATPEHLFSGRRRFLQSVGLGAVAFAALGCKPSGRSMSTGEHRSLPNPNPDLYPAKRNPKYTLDRALTDEQAAARYNNFYEFSEIKEKVATLVDRFETRPWDLEITGLVNRPVKLTVDELVRKLPLEERLYRHRCVEAWAMAVPWTGIPLARVLGLADPLSSARFVRFTSFLKPDQAPNQREATWYKWPYYEALQLSEAMNELAMAVTGIYGHELPKQHGAPIRIVVPWKYGYKSPKSVVRIELVAEQPHTFWNDLAPDEYSFLSNVNPAVPHPRWSQASERLIDTGQQVDTRPYNGYGEFVASLYP
ncbi:MAG TPA: protein-methionine-sulfoxide reductase catalytic subunit MsrP [Candidatus Kapabacteria bacterium]|nr:protein-methionine-sulfoxide reductase catalytic subunit MsrP [Candidatus Kapabacteria bacterium]